MELARFPSRGGFSLRSIFTFVLALIAAVILGATLLSSSTAQAAPSDPIANWNGDAIIYNNHGYNAAPDFKDTTGTIPNGATVYKTPVVTEGTSQKVFILYFSPGVDPPTATTATYVEFDTKNNTLSNPAHKTDIEVTVKGEEDALSSCSVEGVGWLVCPMSVFLAGAMDSLFDILTQMIEVKPPILGDQNNSMYVAWNITRGIANIAFVIVFLIIIYAQLANYQVNNYGIKRLLPRLIVAAILVNLSFYVAALAIDISNILGYSIQDVFNGIRENIFHLTNDTSGATLTDTSWTTVAGVVLAGGGIIGGVYYMASGGLYMLVALLVGLVLTVLFVIVILAARQAIILLLVIVGPLAFVANLLPNTEKWFGKWKDLFFTMLIFFPAFSLVFGGSQLAGQIIIQNAGDNIVMLLFGLAVQVAPLVITPLILKLSGGLLGRIAQITNNPRKGLIDRTRNWGERRAEHTKQQNIARGARIYNPTSWGAGMVRSSDFRKRRLADRTEMWKQNATNRYNRTGGYEVIHMKMFEAEVEKHIIEDGHKKHIQHEVNRSGSRLHLQNVRLEAGKRALEEAMEVTKATIKEYEAGTVPATASSNLEATIKQLQASRENLSVESIRTSKADAQLQRQFAEALKASEALRERAGGIAPLGADSVLAAAVSAVHKADAEDIKNIQDAADFKPGDLEGIATAMQDAIREGNSIRARAFQNMLVTGGGAGMNKFREAMMDMGEAVPTDVSEAMRDNLLANHGAAKAKANDLIDWAAKGGILGSHTTSGKAWAGLSDEDFALQHATSQEWAINNGGVSVERAKALLDDPILNKKISPKILQQLSAIAGRPYPPEAPKE